MWLDAWHQQLLILDTNVDENATSIDLLPLTQGRAAYGLTLHGGVAYISTWGQGDIIKVYTVNGSYQIEQMVTGLSSEVLFSMASLDSKYQPTGNERTR